MAAAAGRGREGERGRAAGQPAMGPAAAPGKGAAARGGREGGAGGQPAMGRRRRLEEGEAS